MHNYIWCPIYIPSLMIIGSVVSEELRWQDFGTDGQTDGVTALLDLLSPLATQVKTVWDIKPIWYSSWRRIIQNNFQHFNRHKFRPPDDSFEHFRNLTSDPSSTYISIANYGGYRKPNIWTLNTKITPHEIDVCIHKLKYYKNAGKDNLINEYFFPNLATYM